MSILEEIIANVKADVALREKEVSLCEIRKRASSAPTPREAIKAIQNNPGAVAIIGELKRSTPLAGQLHNLTNPGTLAADYETGGVSVISCVTEKSHFGGNVCDLSEIRKHISIPILQTDFIVTPYQILEGRVNGADMVMLRVGLLSEEQLKSFIERTESLGMTALVEAESRLEVLQALDAGAKVISVNARDLQTQELCCAKVAEILDFVPAEVLAIAAAGVRGPREVFEYAQMGADAVMVGESLLKCRNVIPHLQELVSAGQHPALLTDRKKRVKMHVLKTQHELYRNQGIN